MEHELRTMAPPTDDGRERPPTSPEERKQTADSDDDWAHRHARTTARDGGRSSSVVTVRMPEEEREWHARHGHVTTLTGR